MPSGFSINLALPDLWQQEAVRHLKAGCDVIVDAPTGAGKTHIFELYFQSGALSGQAIYTVPTRALANDKRNEWAAKGWNVGIATGDVAENLSAPVLVATLETQRENFLRGSGPRLLVVDEYQMLADPVRGLNYELALALAPAETQLLLLSGSVANAPEVAAWLGRLGRRVEIVRTTERPVPLDEVASETLPHRAPRRISNFWPRLAGDVLMANLGPLLIFAPHRLTAEKIARQIAQQLPTPDPLTLTDRQEQVLGAPLAQLLRQRVAYHHSGLGFQQRAGVIEPLAKAGQLRVVVATMGLAAGINFSMRSVMVAETILFDGKVEREIAPDELLQMFGRAGRRGMDETGHVILARNSPRLADAAPKHLRRANQIDWPTLLRVMYRASLAGESPFAAAERLCRALFSRQHLVLGFEKSALAAAEPRASAVPSGNLFGLVPTRTDVYNSRGEWEARDDARTAEVPLAQAKIFFKNHLEHALHVFPFIAAAFPIGRVCWLGKSNGNRVYGKELPLAIERQPRCFHLTRNILELTEFTKSDSFSYDQLDDRVIPQLVPHLCGGRVAGIKQRGEILMLQIDFSKTLHPAYFDSFDVPLIAPEERTIRLEVAPSYRDESGEERLAPSNTAAYAWRKLGLIEPDGTPTQRGAVCSAFQGGEGLAIAAALEDASYPLEELVLHIANLRGGHRLREMPGTGGSERLASACLGAYGAANFEGYLEMGLPLGYGEGTAELLAEIIARPQNRRDFYTEHFGEGDFQRALVEWLSLLRQVKHAPDFQWERWTDFRKHCAAACERYARLLPVRDLPPVPALQIARTPNHGAVSP
ncbi:MAG: DEAD/DEAH box helicase [Verrucomicrobiales bacterium]|nr:DEAD/DEAH box helicase [Verrucomicrobiales bacterium]